MGEQGPKGWMWIGPMTGSGCKAVSHTAPGRSTASGNSSHWERHARTSEISLMRPIRLEASLRMLSVGAISPNA